MRRPDVFTLDYSHPLAHGLTHAFWLDNVPGTNFFSKTHKLTSADGVDVFSDTIWRLEERISLTFSIIPLSTGAVIDSRYLTPFNGIVCEILANNKFRAREGNWNWNISTPDSSVPFGTEAIVSIIKSQNTVALYLNGSLTNSAIVYSDILHSAPFRIGANAEASGAAGEYIDFYKHNRALSPAEIALLADRTDPMLGGLIVEERPVLYFDMGGSTTDGLIGRSIALQVRNYTSVLAARNYTTRLS